MAKEEKARWFKVTGERFDWILSPTKIRSFKKGEVGYAPYPCFQIGIRAGLIEEISKPKGAKVVLGKVVLNGD